MLRRAIVVWVVMLLFASANGALRQAVLIPSSGAVAGRAVSTVMLAALIALLTWVTIPWIRPHSNGEAWMIGGVWVALTLAFEFLAGHYLFGTPWEALLEDYNVVRGRIWILVLIVTMVAPPLCARARGVVPAPR